MRRREFFALLAGGTPAWPLGVAAQTRLKIPRVGVLAGSPATMAHIVDAFRHGLRDLGYVEGETIALEVRWTEGRWERLPELLADLVSMLTS